MTSDRMLVHLPDPDLVGNTDTQTITVRVNKPYQLLEYWLD